MTLLLAAPLAGAQSVERLASPLRHALSAVFSIALLLQVLHVAAYARGLIRGVDPAALGEYRIAKWLDKNRPRAKSFYLQLGQADVQRFHR